MGYNSAPLYKNAYLLADLVGKFCKIPCKFLGYKIVRRNSPAINLLERIENTFFKS